MNQYPDKANVATEADLKESPSPSRGELEDAAMEKLVTRKLDRHILPWIFIMWLLAFIDRSNM